MRSLMQEIGMEKYGEIILSVDNLGVLYIPSDPVYHAWMKHIDVDHFVCERVTSGELELWHVPTTHMTVDILIKALPRSHLTREMSGRTGIADYKFQGCLMYDLRGHIGIK